MGGNAFPTPAARLSTSRLEALQAYATPRLARFFKGITRPKNVKSKTSHGDLDLVCGLDGGEGWKGMERGTVGVEGYQVIGKGGEGWMVELSKEVSVALGGTMWMRSGAEISVAVPVEMLGDAKRNAQEDEVGLPFHFHDKHKISHFFGLRSSWMK